MVRKKAYGYRESGINSIEIQLSILDLFFDQAKIENAARQLFTTHNEINVAAIMFYLNLMKLAKFAHDSFL